MSKTKKIKNLNDLSLNLVEKYEELQDGKITTSKARAYALTANAIINAVKTQLEYNKPNQLKNKINLLQD